MIDTQVAPGGKADVILWWRANRPVNQSYTVFNHLLDEQGNLRAQQDGAPGGGTSPTDWWMPGEIVDDHHVIPIPEEIEAPVDLTLAVGLYTWPSGERSGVDQSCPGASPDRYLELTDIRVRSEP